MFLLKSSDFSFISHDSVLKLNDIRTVSVNRILYQQPGSISLSSDTYKKIEELVIQKYFPSFMHEFKKMEQDKCAVETSLKEKEAELATLSSENEFLKKQIEELSKKISNTNNE